MAVAPKENTYSPTCIAFLVGVLSLGLTLMGVGINLAVNMVFQTHEIFQAVGNSNFLVILTLFLLQIIFISSGLLFLFTGGVLASATFKKALNALKLDVKTLILKIVLLTTGLYTLPMLLHVAQVDNNTMTISITILFPLFLLSYSLSYTTFNSAQNRLSEIIGQICNSNQSPPTQKQPQKGHNK